MILVSPRLPAGEIAAAAAEAPMVIVGRAVRGVDADSVLINEAHGTGLVLDHLVGLGHERIAHVDGGRGAGRAQRRSAYLRNALRRLGHARAGHPRRLHRGRGGQRRRRAAAAAELPTAIFAANDMVAAGLLGGFDRAGVEVPRDVSIVGYDNISIAHLAHVSLTTMDQPGPRWAGSPRAAARPDRQPQA